MELSKSFLTADWEMVHKHGNQNFENYPL